MGVKRESHGGHTGGVGHVPQPTHERRMAKMDAVEVAHRDGRRLQPEGPRPVGHEDGRWWRIRHGVHRARGEVR